VSEADWHSSLILSHRHLWVREGRMLEVCATCPAARPRSHVARGLSLVVLMLGLIAVAGMLVGLSLSEPRFTLTSCSSFASHPSRGAGPGC
jgi:hypothetical protein